MMRQPLFLSSRTLVLQMSHFKTHKFLDALAFFNGLLAICNFLKGRNQLV